VDNSKPGSPETPLRQARHVPMNNSSINYRKAIKAFIIA
jgi:hypothetical protein